MRNLQEVRDRMIQIIGRPEMLGFINARLVLRTGITLSNPNEAVTPGDLAKVLAALKDMGYAVEADGGKR